MRCNSAGFAQDRFGAAAPDRSTLVHGYCAKVAFSETASVSSNGETNGLQGFDLAVALVERMEVPLVLELIDRVQLRFGEILGRRILNQVTGVLSLGQYFRSFRVVVSIKSVKHARQRFVVLLHRVERWQLKASRRFLVGDIAQSPESYGVVFLLG